MPSKELEPGQREGILGAHGASDALVRLCCFHPAYGYEDFLQGYRPETLNGSICFPLRDGAFKTLCADALSRPDEPFFLIIDEINRGDIPRIFGELLTVLEKDKRGKAIVLPVSGSYPQIRDFLKRSLAEIPLMSVDQLALKRESRNDAAVQAELRLTLHMVKS